MDKLTRFLQIPLFLISLVWMAITGLAGLLFGSLQWQAPGWLLGLQNALYALAEWVRRRPLPAAGIALGLALLAMAAWYGWQWWQSRPRPVEIGFSVSAPARTCYECETENAPKPLLIEFDGSVAPLEAAGKAIDPDKAGISLSPATAGIWTWDDDRTLRFQPKEDWPIGQEYELEFARRGFVAEQILLAGYDAEFSTPRFEAAIDANEFYQDPVNAGDKKIVTTLRFSHPVDTGALESRIEMALYNKVNDLIEDKLASPKFTISYDKLKLRAFLHSEPLSVPSKEGRAEVVVAAGVRAARGGNKTDSAVEASVIVPGLYSLAVNDLRLQIVRDERDEPTQVLMLETSFSVQEPEIVSRVHAWLLPPQHPDQKVQAQWERDYGKQPYRWYNTNAVTPAVLKAAQPMTLEYVPNEREHVELHSFRFHADPKREIYVSVDKGLRSFGGYLLADPKDTVLRVPEYPKELYIAQQGALLALSGNRKLSVFTRDLPGMKIEVGRLLPNQLQHLVTQTHGDLGRPNFNNWSFNEDNLAERFSKKIPLPKLRPGEPHYEAIDLAEFMDQPGATRQGIFFLRIQGWDPATDRTVSVDNRSDENSGYYNASTSDTRLIVVTDLGLLVKRTVTGEQDVFVQSIHSGEPASGVTVDVIGRNGEPVVSAVTDSDGHAQLPGLKSFQREKQPVLYLARRGGDSSFLPVDGGNRALDLSRFDVGGVNTTADQARLTAYLFSDRGIYRPGDEIRAAAIVKSQDWRNLPPGLPLLVQVTDPRGTTVKRETLKLSEAGFEDIRYQTREASPTGSYTLNLYVIRDQYRQDLVGTMSVNVQEFLPDRLKMSAHFSAGQVEGWVSPEQLQVGVTLQNLFGTPAENRRVRAMLTLSPYFPRFTRYPDYEFRDPQAAKDGYSESLADGKTDAAGEAVFDLNLQRFARATYRAHLVFEGYEADGGRGVSAETAQLVSSLPYLVGWKADGDLGYIPRGSERRLSFLGIDPKAVPTAIKDLKLQRIERRYVSVLIKQDSGTYKYESRLKEVKLDEKPFAIAAAGSTLVADTATPGNYSYVVADKDGQVFARIDYAVAGQANLSRSLEKNAELQIVLNKKDYTPGEDIEMQINAPWAGAGLITIERDKVFAWRWFRTTTTSSVQKIRLPEGVEGSAYVSVSFVRDLSSEEIYTSPLSYGVQPFSVALDRRRNEIMLDAPALVKPGDALKLRYRAAQPGRIVLFVIDEGILQVARYRTPDPLGHFFQKRALDVHTRQILDLVLPEFRTAMLSAPGGDGEALLGQNLNPFRRKTDQPVAWWSGIVDADTSERELTYTVPDYFNGTLRVMAVAVNDDSIGVAEKRATVRGDFVLSPNAPLTVTPGDEFEVSVGVANNVAGSGKDAPVVVSLEPSGHLEVLGARQQTVPITELRESSARFRLKVRDEPGAASLKFSAALNGKSARIGATLSVRPATPWMAQLDAGSFRDKVEITTGRSLYPQYRKLQASVSPLPLALAHGLSGYLGGYDYSCTEQLVSMAMPAVVLSSRPEFGYLKTQPGASLEGLIDELRRRQNGDGAYRYWPGGVQQEEFASIYTQFVLLEALARGRAVPRDLLDAGNGYLRSVAGRDGNNLADERNTAFAIYLLARQGNVVANEAAGLQKRLEERHAKEWRSDIAAAWLAGAYQLMKQQALADRAIEQVRAGREVRYDRWHGPMVSDAVILYVLSKHFPERLAKLPEPVLDLLVKRVKNGEYSSLAAATTILALDAYAAAASPVAAGRLSIVEIPRDHNKEPRPLSLQPGLFPVTTFTQDAAKLSFGNDSGLRAYYLVNQSGFDRKPPGAAIKQDFEIIREYTDIAGKPLTQVKMGDEIVVHVKYRTINRQSLDDAVLVDLLPGGFEPVLPRRDAPEQPYVTAADAGSGEYSDEEGYEYDGEEYDETHDQDAAQEDECACGILWDYARGGVDFSDVREDRVVVYARATAALQEFTYRIKATNVGRYTVPPAYGESMYESQVKARSAAGSIEVVRPQ